MLGLKSLFKCLNITIVIYSRNWCLKYCTCNPANIVPVIQQMVNSKVMDRDSEGHFPTLKLMKFRAVKAKEK